MSLILSILSGEGAIRASASGETNATLVYSANYEEGDILCLQSDKPVHVVTQMEDSLPPVCGYLKSTFHLTVPFGEKGVSYSPKSFRGDTHLLWAREAESLENKNYRNLALNPLDSHDNAGLFPHAKANVETRGESVFAARNAIDGNTASSGHGAWPYESWGVNRREDAEILIDFGREVTIDRLVVTLRADFPHDNWWQSAAFTFSDGSELPLSFVKSGLPQAFPIPPRKVSWLKMSRMVKDPADPSPFPALVQLEAWGYDI